jgi:cathepsin B
VVGQYPECGDSKPTPKCVKECNSSYDADYENDKIFGVDSYKIPNKDEEAYMAELMTYGPIEVSLTVYEDFLTYTSGVYEHADGKSLGGHAVKMIGWGVEDGVKYWLCVNSWNEDWGNKGLFKILRGENHCGIETGAYAGTVKL